MENLGKEGGWPVCTHAYQCVKKYVHVSALARARAYTHTHKHTYTGLYPLELREATARTALTPSRGARAGAEREKLCL